MEVKDRIKQGEYCLVIELNDTEKNVYSGCGWKIAAFSDDEGLVKLHGLDEYAWRSKEKFQDTVSRATNVAVDKAKEFTSEGLDTWLVMCSGYELCEPSRIDPNDAASVAKMARIIGDELEEQNEADLAAIEEDMGY